MRSDWKPWWAVISAGFGGALTVFGLGVVSWSCALLALLTQQGLFVVPSVVALLLLVAAGLLSATSSFTLAAVKTPLLITPRGWRQQHALARGRQTADAVVLQGDVGRALQVVLTGHRTRTVVDAHPSPDGPGPTYPTVFDIASEIAGVLGVPLHDHLDHGAWARWHRDPGYRAQVRFELTGTRNRADYPHWHGDVALEPTRLQHVHDGMWSPGWTLDARTFSDGATEVATASIRAVDVHFTTHVTTVNNVVIITYRGAFLVLTADRIVRMAERSVMDNSALEMLGEAHRIREALRVLRPPEERGGASDVPEALRELRT